MREEAQKKAKRNRVIWQSSIGVAVLVVVAIVILVVVNVAKPTNTAGPANMLSDGIVLTSTTSYVSTPGIPNGGTPTATKQASDGKAHITTYIDYQCPYCDEFETTNDSQLSQWLDAGKITLEVHPISILDRSSDGNMYSTRSANAAACVAQYDPSKFWAVTEQFYKDQPAEDTDGHTNAQILSDLSTAGVSSSQVTSCVQDKTYAGWVGAASQRILKGPIPNSSVSALTGTPTVIVNGQSYGGSLTDASAFKAFVEQAANITLS